MKLMKSQIAKSISCTVERLNFNRQHLPFLADADLIWGRGMFFGGLVVFVWLGVLLVLFVSYLSGSRQKHGRWLELCKWYTAYLLLLWMPQTSTASIFQSTVVTNWRQFQILLAVTLACHWYFDLYFCNGESETVWQPTENSYCYKTHTFYQRGKRNIFTL